MMQVLRAWRISLRESWRRSREVWLLALACLLLSARVSFATPPFSNPDEGTHYLRAYEVRKLRLVNSPGRQGVRMRCLDYLIAGKKYAPVPFFQEEVVKNADQPNCRVQSLNSAGSYSPVPYFPSALMLKAGDLEDWTVETELFAARFASGALGCLAMLVGLLAIERFRAVMALIFLLPMSFWLRSSLSPDSLLLASQFLFVCFVLRLAERQTIVGRLEHIVLFVSAVLIGFSKGPYAITCLSTFALWSFRRPEAPRWLVGLRLAAPFLVAAACAALWSRLAQQTYTFDFSQWGIDPEAQRRLIEAHPWKYFVMWMKTLWTGGGWLRQMHLHAPWVTASDATIFTALLMAVLPVLAATTATTFRPLARIYLVLLGLLPAVAMFPYIYLNWNPVGEKEIWGVQGRYFLPFYLVSVVGLCFERPADLQVSPRLRNALGMGLPLAVNVWLAFTRM